MTTYSVIAKSVPREDGPDKVSGEYVFPADIVLPGMIWGRALRSPFPHAKIVHIDASRAKSLPGVHAVLTGKDVAGMRVGRMVRDIPFLAEDKVRFVGDKVAAVAAEDPEIADEALTLIDVKYEELPAVFDPLEAMEPGAPLIHEGPYNLVEESGTIQPQGNLVHHAFWSHGDVEQGFRESDLIFEHNFSTPWVHQAYIEPYSCVVHVDEDDRIQVWSNNKQPFYLRKQISQALGCPEERIKINPCGIGGDFGGKGAPMDVPVAYALSSLSGRPVKMIMDYIEELMAGNPRHPAVVTIKTGLKKDGRFWARKSRVVFNGGAYAGFRGSLNTSGGRQVGGGPYYIPNFHIDNYMVYTNNLPCGSYRAPGEPQALFAVESHTDMIAREMGLDPYELRLKNVVHEGQITATGQQFRHVLAEETLRTVAEASNWDSPKKGPYFGRGMSLGQRAAAEAKTVARVSIDEHANVTLYTPVPETGVGAHTVSRQMIAEGLGIRADEVTVVRLSTDDVPFDKGAGAGTSRNAAAASLGAAQEVRRKLTTMAAEFYGWPEERIVFGQGRVFVEGDQDKGVSLQDLASKTVAALGGTISFEYTHVPTGTDVTAFCAQVAEVEVDPETGQIKLHRYISANDSGTIVNPVGHQGQIEGGIIQGLGYALMEGLESEEGRISTLSLGEAKIPTTLDIPELKVVLVESPEGSGPYGGKCIGEVCLSPVAAAIANAVADATGGRIPDLPITAEKVLFALKEKGK